MAAISSITIRRARRDDVGVIVAMLADDPLGSARERLEDPLPASYFRAFEALEHASHIQLVVAEDEEASRRTLHPARTELAGARADDRGCSRHALPSRGVGENRVMGRRRSARQGLRAGRGCRDNTRVDAQRFYARLGFSEPRRHDVTILIQPARIVVACVIAKHGLPFVPLTGVLPGLRIFFRARTMAS
jgi:hypothetical protein